MDERNMWAPEDVQQRLVANRDARTFLPFLLPHVRPGMDILDAGCGVGSIARDIAANFGPRRIVGIDIDSEQIEEARRSAAERELDNVEFETASVNKLPFADATFDIVYANAVLHHVQERMEALEEMRRVLRPGGLAAVSDDYMSTLVVSPDQPSPERAIRLLERVVSHEGGNPYYSRHLRSLMSEAGFTRTQGVATAAEVYGDAASTRWIAGVWGDALGAPSVSDVILGEGWASRAELDSVITALREWGERPDAFASWLYCGALGWTS